MSHREWFALHITLNPETWIPERLFEIEQERSQDHSSPQSYLHPHQGRFVICVVFRVSFDQFLVHIQFGHTLFLVIYQANNTRNRYIFLLLETECDITRSQVLF